MWGLMGEYGGYGIGMYGFWGIFMILFFWGLVIVLVLAAARCLFGGVPTAHRDAPESSRQALDILDERYARGEIEREEYLQKRKDLE